MYTREELINICEQAIIQEKNWKHHETPSSISQLGTAWAYLKAGCKFTIFTSDTKFSNLKSTPTEIWFSISHHNADSIEDSEIHKRKTSTFYLPTPQRLLDKAGTDWNFEKKKVVRT